MNKFLIISIVFLLLSVVTSQAQAKQFTNFIGMDFVDIPIGTFYMGSCDTNGSKPSSVSCENKKRIDNDAFAEEFPRHAVEISKTIQFGIYEVTVEQFLRSASAPSFNELKKNTDFLGYNVEGKRPVVFISWDDVNRFLAWLNDEKPPSDSGHYRLPTEAEWEYVSRAGSNDIFFFGNTPDTLQRYAWYSKNSMDMGHDAPHPVGTLQPNPWGVYDLYGNVWEWVSDWFDASYYSVSQHTNPQGPDGGQLRTIRGGGFNFDPSYSRSSARESYLPSKRSRTIGFRVVRELNQ